MYLFTYVTHLAAPSPMTKKAFISAKFLQLGIEVAWSQIGRIERMFCRMNLLFHQKLLSLAVSKPSCVARSK
jgi:hypothetical protein